MKLILIFPNSTAEIAEGDQWQSANRPLAAMLDAMNADLGRASYLPHPYLHVAEAAVAELGATLQIEGEPDPTGDELH